MFNTNHWFETVFAAYQLTLNSRGCLATNIYFLLVIYDKELITLIQSIVEVVMDGLNL